MAVARKILKGLGLALGAICLVVSAVYASTTVCDNAIVGNGMMIGYDDEGSPEYNTLTFYQAFENKILFDGWDSYITGGTFSSEDYLSLGSDGTVVLDNGTQECTFGGLGSSKDGAEFDVTGDIELECETAGTKLEIASGGDIVMTFGNDD